MRTNIVIDDGIMAKTIAVSGIKTKRELVETAIVEFIRSRERKNLLDLFGSNLIAEDYDYKSLRYGSHDTKIMSGISP
ncbi:hypothetical protein AGMMS49957_16940 [Synergistales bacterium]|nr:hypothetical protein AGMMS49957_16940 [Synergistales bacterium]